MPVTPLPRVSARILQKNIAHGRCKPDVVNCTGTAQPGDYVVKLTASMEFGVQTLANEVVCFHLAGLLGVQTPPAAIVDVSAEFVAALDDPLRQSRYAKSLGHNFGSEYRIGGFATWPAGKIINMGIRQACLEGFAFDALIQNPDRRVDNPNLLYRADDVVLYDHELAFSNHLTIGSKESRELRSQNLGFLQRHVFWAGLKGRGVDLNRMEGALRAIDAATLAGIEDDVPTPWQTASLEPILGYLADLAADPGRLTRTVQELLA